MSRIAAVAVLGAVPGAIVFADAAHAYIGPGLGAGAIGTVIGILGSILVALFAVLYYPIKRMVKRRKAVGTTAAVPGESKPDA
jgi:preprotein translocase subunit SecD